MNLNEDELVDEISKLAASAARYGLSLGRTALMASAQSLEEAARLLTELAARLRNP
jgi:hypothetical protein